MRKLLISTCFFAFCFYACQHSQKPQNTDITTNSLPLDSMSKTVKIYTQAEMVALLQPVIEQSGSTFQKKTKVIAHRAKGGEKIETITSDGKETMNTATKGDYIVKNTTSAGESYIVPADKFEKRYTLIESLGTRESLYQATGRIQAIKLDSPLLKALEIADTTFQFKAAWGENMVAKKGDYLAMPIGSKPEVYRIALKEFEETYQ